MSEFGMRPTIRFMRNYFKDKPVKGLEIGVFKGINAQRFLDTLNIEELYLIDIWITPSWLEPGIYEQYYSDVLKKFGNNEKVLVIKDFSFQAASYLLDNTFDFIYIDGDHSYKGCKEDIENYYPKAKNNGILCGHDYYCIEGVKRAVDEFVKKYDLKLITSNAIGMYDNVKYGEWLIIKP